MCSIPNSTIYNQAICTCTAFYKKHKCKHIIGILARKDIYPNSSITIPQGAKSISIGQKRGPGRPALAKTALIRQTVTTTAAPVLLQPTVSPDAISNSTRKRVSEISTLVATSPPKKQRGRPRKETAINNLLPEPRVTRSNAK